MMKFQDSIEYQYFPVSFTVLTLCGIWYPENWTNKKKFIYKIYTFLILLLAIVLFMEVFIKIILIYGTDKFSLENVFAAIVFAVGFYKKINVLYFRERIIGFIFKYANNQWYKPRNDEETFIHSNIQNKTRRITKVYASFIIISIIFRATTPILESGTFIVLPLDGWYPYNVENFMTFWLTYIHQVVSGITLTCMHLSVDTLFVGLLLQMCCQLNILKLRLKVLKKLNNQITYKTEKVKGELMKDTILQRITEHESIYRFGIDLQDTFKPILMGQMVVVVPSLIINVYFLSIDTDELNLKYLTTLFFALVSFMQIFMFCWYGNEVILGSLDVGDALYESDWIDLDEATKKICLTILTRTSKSILITAGAAIPLNVDSLAKIMRTSYSAFNLLQQTAAK